MDTKKMTNYKLLLDALSVQIERIVNAAVSAEALGVTPLFDPRGQVSFESAKFEGMVACAFALGFIDERQAEVLVMHMRNCRLAHAVVPLRTDWLEL